MKVYPMLVGELEAHEGDVYRGGNVGVKSPFPCYAFYIEGAEKRILVETGFGDPDRCKKYLNATEGFILKRDPGLTLEDQLQKRGVSPDSIEIVILTHCHWDHIGSIGLFANATIYCQREELSWAIFPQHWMRRSFIPEFAEPLIAARDRIVVQKRYPQNLLVAILPAVRSSKSKRKTGR
jgi:glyoxylase-like metal-dependent hydrolase (beta-lactamase superfamily II)